MISVCNSPPNSTINEQCWEENTSKECNPPENNTEDQFEGDPDVENNTLDLSKLPPELSFIADSADEDFSEDYTLFRKKEEQSEEPIVQKSDESDKKESDLKDAKLSCINSFSLPMMKKPGASGKSPSVRYIPVQKKFICDISKTDVKYAENKSPHKPLQIRFVDFKPPLKSPNVQPPTSLLKEKNNSPNADCIFNEINTPNERKESEESQYIAFGEYDTPEDSTLKCHETEPKAILDKDALVTGKLAQKISEIVEDDKQNTPENDDKTNHTRKVTTRICYGNYRNRKYSNKNGVFKKKINRNPGDHNFSAPSKGENYVFNSEGALMKQETLPFTHFQAKSKPSFDNGGDQYSSAALGNGVSKPSSITSTSSYTIPNTKCDIEPDINSPATPLKENKNSINPVTDIQPPPSEDIVQLRERTLLDENAWKVASDLSQLHSLRLNDINQVTSAQNSLASSSTLSVNSVLSDRKEGPVTSIVTNNPTEKNTECSSSNICDSLLQLTKDLDIAIIGEDTQIDEDLTQQISEGQAAVRCLDTSTFLNAEISSKEGSFSLLGQESDLSSKELSVVIGEKKEIAANHPQLISEDQAGVTYLDDSSFLNANSILHVALTETVLTTTTHNYCKKPASKRTKKKISKSNETLPIVGESKPAKVRKMIRSRKGKLKNGSETVKKDVTSNYVTSNKPIEPAPATETSIKKNLPIEPDLFTAKPFFYFGFNFNQHDFSAVICETLEFMFKYESLPSSASMSRLAKLIRRPWRSVRDWFNIRRLYCKKNHLSTRPSDLISCIHCKNFKPTKNERPIIHLLSKNHVENILGEEFIENDFKFDKNKDSHFSLSSNILPEIIVDDSFVLDEFQLHNREEREIVVKKPLIEAAYSFSKLPKTRLKMNDMASILGDSNMFPVSSEETFKGPFNSTNLKVQRIQNEETCKGPFNSSNLKVQRIQNEEKIGYKCPICTLVFLTEWSLIHHSLSHRKFICHNCEKLFSNEHNLLKHLVKHLLQAVDSEQIDEFACSLCKCLICECAEPTITNPVYTTTTTKTFSRPQMAKRSKPFHSHPYSGRNDHLIVSLKECLSKKQELTRVPEVHKRLNNDKVQSTANSQVKFNSKIIDTCNCNFCDASFYNKDELDEHLFLHTLKSRRRKKRDSPERNVTTRLPEDKKQKSNKVFSKCRTCGRTFAPTAKYEYSCPSCKTHEIKCKNKGKIYKIHCLGCNKAFQHEFLLRVHIRSYCLKIPKDVRKLLVEYNLFQLERLGHGKYYKWDEIARQTSDKHPKKLAVDAESTDHSQGSNSEPNMKNLTAFTIKSIGKAHSVDQMYFMCVYCNIPYHSERTMIRHLKKFCRKIPPPSKSKLIVKDIDWIKENTSNHYRKVKGNELSKYFSESKENWRFQIPCTDTNLGYSRVTCSFCGKKPFACQMKTHIVKSCTKVPPEVSQESETLEDFLKYFTGFDSTKMIASPLSGGCDLSIKGNTKYLYEEHPENELPCLLCEDKFGNLNELLIHSVIHSESKELFNCWQCNECDLSFRTCIEHRMEHSGEVPYHCHFCSEKFGRSHKLIEHLEKNHGFNNINEMSSHRWICSSSEYDSMQSTNESPIKATKHSYEISGDCFLESDLCLENIAELMPVTDDYVNYMEGVTEENDGRNKENVSPAIEECHNVDELLDNMDNLDSCVETVELCDTNLEEKS